MRITTRFIAAILTTLLAGTVFTASGYQPPAERDPMQDLVISAEELTADIEKGTTIIGDELAPELSTGSSFTSQTIESPIPFNAVVPHWEGTNAEAISLQVRTSPDGETWGDWLAVGANHDWMVPGEDEVVGEMVLVPGEGVTHRFVQVQVLFNNIEETVLGSELETGFLGRNLVSKKLTYCPLATDHHPKAPLLPLSLSICEICGFSSSSSIRHSSFVTRRSQLIHIPVRFDSVICGLSSMV